MSEAEQDTTLPNADVLPDADADVASGADATADTSAAADAGTADAAAAGAAAGEQPRDADGKFAKPKAEVPKWVQPRINELTGKLRSTEAELTKAKNEAAVLKASLEAKGQPSGETPKAPPAEADIDRLVSERLAQQQAHAAAQKVVTEGQAKYKDFSEVLGNYRNVADLNNAAGAQFLQNAIDTGAGHDVLYHLGQNLDEAQRVLSLSPGQQAVELYKLAESLKTSPRPTTKMPAPTSPVGGRARANPGELRDDDDTATWIAQRNKQVEERRKSGRFQLH